MFCILQKSMIFVSKQSVQALLPPVHQSTGGSQIAPSVPPTTSSVFAEGDQVVGGRRRPPLDRLWRTPVRNTASGCFASRPPTTYCVDWWNQQVFRLKAIPGGWWSEANTDPPVQRSHQRPPTTNRQSPMVVRRWRSGG